jgi:hypothetical protein
MKLNVLIACRIFRFASHLEQEMTDRRKTKGDLIA